MDTRLEKALEFSNYRRTIEIQRKTLKTRVDTMLNINYQNSIFKANAETISFVKALVDLGNTDGIVMDTKSNPIEIDSLSEFLEALVDAYNTAMNEYFAGYSKIQKARNIKKLMDW